MPETTRNNCLSGSSQVSMPEPVREGSDDAASARGRPGKWLFRGAILVAGPAVITAGLIALGNVISTSAASVLTAHTVDRGDMLITIQSEGTLESSNNLDIKCEVPGGTMILWLVENGSEVKQGEVLARLESSQIEDQIGVQKITYEKARASRIQAEKLVGVARQAVQEYLEGTYRQQCQTLDAQITVAMENLRSAENTCQYTERMFRKGYASPLQVAAQRFAVQRATLDRDAARTAKDVLDRFTKIKLLEDLRSQSAAAEARAASEAAAFSLEENRLKRLETQLAKCTIRAPRDGVIVYANEMGGGRRGPPRPEVQIEEGARLREQQTVFWLPDVLNMQAKIAIHESKIAMVRLGMRARVSVQGRVYQGTVAAIANQPARTDPMSANVKEYLTIVKIDGHAAGLRPGMTAQVEILLASLQNVLTLPMNAVVEQRGKFFCWVKKGNGAQRRPLLLGLTDNKVLEIKDGVADGEQVILNPRAFVPEARDEGVASESREAHAIWDAAVSRSWPLDLTTTF